MSLAQAINIVENELRCEAKRASFLRDCNKHEGYKKKHFNLGFWSGNKQGLEFAIEKVSELRRLICSTQQ